MSRCFCGEKCYSFELYENNNDKIIVYNINKCSKTIFSLNNDFKWIENKRKPCEYYNKNFLKKMNCENKKEYNNFQSIKETDIIKEINFEIKLLKINKDYNLKYYHKIENINYYLRKINHKPFDIKKETIKSLEERIKFKGDIKPKENKSQYSCVIKLPSNLSVEKYNKHNKNRECNYNNLIIYDVSDEDSEEESNLESFGFDVEDFSSDEDSSIVYFSD